MKKTVLLGGKHGLLLTVGIAPTANASLGHSALTRLKTAVGLVDYVDPATTADHTAITVTVF